MNRRLATVAEAYLKYLYSPEGQTIIAKNYYRPIDAEEDARPVGMKPVKLFTVDEVFGGWQTAQEGTLQRRRDVRSDYSKRLAGHSHVKSNSASVLPGFGLTMGFTLLYLSLIVLIPLGAAGAEVGDDRLERFLAGGERSAGGGVLQAQLRGVAGGGARSTPSSASSWPGCWCAIRFPAGILDAMVDLPFAMPTAVSGIALTCALRHATAGSAAG